MRCSTLLLALSAALAAGPTAAEDGHDACCAGAPHAGAAATRAATPAPTAPARPAATFDNLLARYEAIRYALVHDTDHNVAKNAAEIARLASGLPAAQAAPAARLKDAARRLQDASGLEPARAAFGDLSTALIEVRRQSGARQERVAYCSMARKSWLQPDGEIGNPYYGQSMARCGEFVK